MSQTHKLKTWPEFFEAVVIYDKRFEIRKDDRGFAVGDLLILREWDPEDCRYTGREYRTIVKYITHFDQPPGQVVMSISEGVLG